jgi:hypothetical protein
LQIKSLYLSLWIRTVVVGREMEKRERGRERGEEREGKRERERERGKEREGKREREESNFNNKLWRPLSYHKLTSS